MNRLYSKGVSYNGELGREIWILATKRWILKTQERAGNRVRGDTLVTPSI
jgi:hypothetical protein